MREFSFEGEEQQPDFSPAADEAAEEARREANRQRAKEWREKQKEREESAPSTITQRAPKAPYTGKRRGRPPKNDRIKQLEEALTDRFVEIGSGVSLIAPTTGIVVTNRAPKRAQALCKIAERNPKVLESLERIVAGSVVFELAVDALAIGYAVAVDMEQAEPFSAPARALGVSEAYSLAHETDEESDTETVPSFLRGASTAS